MESLEKEKRGSPPMSMDNLTDAAAKNLLSRPEFLSLILKHTIPELKDRDTEWIRRNSFTEGGVTVGGKDVDDVSRRVVGRNTESASPGEGRVTFDLLFDAILPDGNGSVKVIVNIEVQKDDTGPGTILKRAAYYTSRLISDQKGTVFQGDEYSRIEKVYSIWIMLAPPRSRQNSVTLFRTIPENITGNATYREKDYDNSAIVMICLGKWDEAEGDLLRMLDIMFDRTLSDSEKCGLWESECSVAIADDTRKETGEVCNYSSYVRDVERDCYSALILKLSEKNRTDEIVKAAADREYLLKLYDEFEIKYAH